MILDEKTIKRIESTREKYEFLTFVVSDNDIMIGIVQNETPKLLMMYQLDLIKDQPLREKFLRYGDEWWWGSNQSIPVNSFLGRRFDVFERYLRGYPKKSIKTIIGPTFNLDEKYLKRIKKKRIEIMTD